MKKLLSVVLAITLIISAVPLGVFTFTASAETVYTEGYYNYTVENGEAIITQYTGSASSVSIPSTLGGYPVTGIGGGAFKNCENITNVNIGSNINSIGYDAFYGTALYSDNTNWKNNVLYIGDHLIAAKWKVSGECIVKGGTLTIADYAFSYCSNLTSVTMPNSVISIGNSAFDNCDSIISVNIPDSVTRIGNSAFYNCESLTDVSIGDGVTSIGEEAFCSCENLISANVGNNVVSIGNSAFSYCSKLESAIIPKSVASIGEYAFEGCSSLTEISIPNNVASIGIGAFNRCTNLIKITLPDTAIEMSGDPFWNTAYYNDESNWENDVLYIGKHLIDVKNTISGDYAIKEGTLTMADYAFSSCEELTSITIPSSLKSIGDVTFERCYNLASVYIPNSITSIGSDAFCDCYKIENVYITDISAWCNIDFENENSFPNKKKNSLRLNGEKISGEIVLSNDVKKIPKYTFENSDITSITIPDSVISMGDYAFSNCANLESVTLGCNIVNISNGAFYNCESLVSITIPDSVESIGHSAFDNCESLTDVSIGDGVTSIGEEAFYSCENLISANVGSNVVNIGNSAFYGCSKLESAIIPKGVVSIGDKAYYNCYGLEEVWYTGSEEEREGIEFGSNNEYLTDATWYYNICDINEHKYAAACDAICENCVWRRTVNGAHTFNSDNLCTLCGYSKILEYITYYITDNTVSITNCSTNISGKYVIPSTIEGYPVTSIDDWAFDSCSKLTGITIPDTVTNIGVVAFLGCNKLASVTIGNSVVSIGDSAFAGCDSLTSVTIPDSVTSIGSYAFGGCDNLKTVTIGKGAISIAENAFNDDYAMEKYVVDAKNTAYSSDENGVLFNKKKTKIIAYPSANTAKEYSLPESVTDIVYFAFGNCDNLIKVDMPESVKSIDVDAFRDCDNLSDIVVPKTVKNIEENAFFGCDRLDDIWYLGSEQNKSGISIKDGNESLEAADWHYNTCKPGEHKFTDDNDKTCENCDWSLAEPGDTNDDGNINNKDLGLLMQHLNGWKVEINADAADVNGDGNINNKDYGLLMQYCNGWDVKLQ